MDTGNFDEMSPTDQRDARHSLSSPKSNSWRFWHDILATVTLQALSGPLRCSDGSSQSLV